MEEVLLVDHVTEDVVVQVIHLLQTHLKEIPVVVDHQQVNTEVLVVVEPLQQDHLLQDQLLLVLVVQEHLIQF